MLGTPQPLSQQLFLAKPNASGHGISIMSQLYDVTARFWKELVSPPNRPLAFRFLPEFTTPLQSGFNTEFACLARVERHAAREKQLIRRG